MIDPFVPPTGAFRSESDIRTFTYPTTPYKSVSGGKKYEPGDIEYQNKVGICTAISLTQNARKALGNKFSAEFQYLIQKKYYDFNWEEGSSIFSALKAAKGIGLLPVENWTYTTDADRALPYDQYIAKLKDIPDSEIAKLILIANQNKIKAYAQVPVNRDAMAQAIDESKAGILIHFLVGQEWYTAPDGTVTWDKKYIEPLRAPKTIISGHAITESNYSGNSFRVANTWSDSWADQGTAYFLLGNYKPIEAWAVWYDDVHPVIATALAARTSLWGKILDLIHTYLWA